MPKNVKALISNRQEKCPFSYFVAYSCGRSQLFSLVKSCFPTWLYWLDFFFFSASDGCQCENNSNDDTF